MRLTLDQIKSVTVGAVSITEQNDGIHFYRSTKKQIDAWTALKPEIGQRATVSTSASTVKSFLIVFLSFIIFLFFNKTNSKVII